MATPELPGLMTRMRAKLAGEVASDTLDAYRSAGAPAYGLLVDAESRRTALDETDYWQVPRTDQIFFLCAWNAYALQILGDAFVDADYEYDPKTKGYVPPVTAEQATAFYGDVEEWLVRARQAVAVGNGYELDLHIPAELPAWVEVEPCPMPHLHAMLRAGETLREHAEIAVSDLKQRAPAERTEDVAKIASLLAEVTTAAEYANSLHSELHGRAAASKGLHERIERSIKNAIEKAFLVGQLAAMPELRLTDATAIRAHETLPAPGEPGFDPWVLTDPHTRPNWQKNREARRAIDNLWRKDPDPVRTLDIQAQIDAALATGAVDYAQDSAGRRFGNYYCCPWSPIYVARRPVTIGGTRMRALQQFTFDVSAEEMAEGGEFTRELLLGNFAPTNEVDYCNPESGNR